MGWAIVKGGKGLVPEYIASGVARLPREKVGKKDEPYQKYRLRVINFMTHTTQLLIDDYDPDYVVNESVPPIGTGAFGGGSMQAQLAAAAAAAAQAVSYHNHLVVEQVAAITIKKNIAGNRDATKVKVRNGVFALLPELAIRKKDWVKEFEEPDAIATGLTDLGYKNVDEKA
jgi:Holliday junction resolvasome RuvABC endonuclease subunit